MSKFVANLKNGFKSVREDDERGDIVQTIVVMVILVVAAVAVGKFLWPVIQGQAQKTKTTIDGSTDGTSF